MIDFKLLTVIVVVVLILLGIFFYWLSRRQKPRARWVDKLEEKYRQLLLSEKNQDKRFFLIQLDKLYEYGLQQKYRSQSSLGQLLKSNSKSFVKSELSDLWTAHKLRNKLVHDVDHKSEISELNFAVLIFKKYLQDLISN